MKPQATAAKFLALAGTGMVLTMIPIILGGPFLRVLFKAYKPVYYWIFGIAVSALFVAIGAPAYTIILGSVWLLIGVYNEVEKRGGGWIKAGGLSLLLSTAFMLGGLAIVLQSYAIDTWARYVLLVSELLENLRQISPTIKMDANILAQQTPSIFGSLLVMTLGTALVFEKKAASIFNVSTKKVASQLRLLEFELPDFVIWTLLLAFLFSMVNLGMVWLSALGLNLVNIGVVLLFFQGLAVLEVSFAVMKTSLFLKALTYIILVGLFPVIVSGLGLIDYWVDFRSRLRKMRAAEMN